MLGKRYVLIDTMVFGLGYSMQDEYSIKVCRRAWYKCFNMLMNLQLSNEYKKRIREIGHSPILIFEKWTTKWADEEKYEWIYDLTDVDDITTTDENKMANYSEDIGIIWPVCCFKRTHRSDEVFFVTAEEAILNDQWRLKSKHSINVLSPRDFSHHIKRLDQCTNLRPPLLSL